MTVNMTTVTETGQDDSRGSDAGGAQIPTVRILVCLGLFIIIIITIIGNVVVVAAFVIEKKLRTTFTFYILNLAITDVCVAVTAMTFYTFDILLGWWPFGEVRHIYYVLCWSTNNSLMNHSYSNFSSFYIYDAAKPINANKSTHTELR